MEHNIDRHLSGNPGVVCFFIHANFSKLLSKLNPRFRVHARNDKVLNSELHFEFNKHTGDLSFENLFY